MKLIIDIPEELAEEEHWYTEEELWTVIKAAENGTPLDDVKAEITEHHDIILGKLKSRSNIGILMFGSDAYNRGIKHAIKILDNIGKAESEVKPNDKRTDKSL